MNKTELVDAIAKDSGLTRADSSRALESLLATVTRPTLRHSSIRNFTTPR